MDDRRRKDFVGIEMEGGESHVTRSGRLVSAPIRVQSSQRRNFGGSQRMARIQCYRHFPARRRNKAASEEEEDKEKEEREEEEEREE